MEMKEIEKIRQDAITTKRNLAKAMKKQSHRTISNSSLLSYACQTENLCTIIIEIEKMFRKLVK